MRNLFAEPEEMVVTHAPWGTFKRHSGSMFSFVDISVDTKSHGVQRVQRRLQRVIPGSGIRFYNKLPLSYELAFHISMNERCLCMVRLHID